VRCWRSWNLEYLVFDDPTQAWSVLVSFLTAQHSEFVCNDQNLSWILAFYALSWSWANRMHNRPELADKVGSHIAEYLHISTGSCVSVVIGYCLSVTLVRCRYRTLSCSIVFAFCLGWLCFWSVQVETGTIQRALLCPRDLVHWLRLIGRVTPHLPSSCIYSLTRTFCCRCCWPLLGHAAMCVTSPLSVAPIDTALLVYSPQRVVRVRSDTVACSCLITAGAPF